MSNDRPLLEPMEFPLTNGAGETKVFHISKFPAIAGREIIAKYPLSNLPRVGEYAVSEEIMVKLMNYVAVEIAPGNLIRLSSRPLIDNHAGDWETLARLEWKMLEYNCSFFPNALTSDFFESISQKVIKLISPMLTDLLAQLSDPEKRP